MALLVEVVVSLCADRGCMVLVRAGAAGGLLGLQGQTLQMASINWEADTLDSNVI